MQARLAALADRVKVRWWELQFWVELVYKMPPKNQSVKPVVMIAGQLSIRLTGFG